MTDELWCFFLFLVMVFSCDALVTRRRFVFFLHCFPEVLQNATVGHMSRRNLFFTWPIYVASLRGLWALSWGSALLPSRKDRSVQ